MLMTDYCRKLAKTDSKFIATKTPDHVLSNSSDMLADIVVFCLEFFLALASKGQPFS